MAQKTPEEKDDLSAATVRELGRTRIEIVPRDSTSVFVYWEVANTSPSDAVAAPEETTPETTFIIDIRREADDESDVSFETPDRLEGRIVEVPAGFRYYATLSLSTPNGPQRLARSTTSAGPTASEQGEPRFVKVSPSDKGLSLSEVEGEGERDSDGEVKHRRARWEWSGTDSSSH